MELEFLGTGAGSPAKFRNVSAVALKLLDEVNAVWLFDVGEGTQHQILRTTIRPRKVERIFITHLHGDHIFGLPGFLSSRSFQSGEEIRPLTIYGPKGIADFVKISLKVSQTHLSYPLSFVELTEDGVVFEDNKFKVSCCHLDHRIECLGYRIEEKDHPGELLIDKLRAEHVPSGPIYGRIKAGETVTLEDGRVLHGVDYIGAPQKGRVVTILGDTRQTPGILTLAKNADVLVHESTFGKGEARLARNYYHSTCIQAAKIAQKAQVKQLLLNHISARYVGALATQLERDARSIFANTRVVKDFEVIDIPFKKKGSDF
ncbi:ribonuclease Z [Ligilactobacillus apodemi]|uniref:Ribonuclease Z n=1 Tax=Ligilactobacillus apodemi DSM 16634 = JCM 16172 TaxID=1423724 RepID=A0A0R1TTW2_9LACO|nr:ribonuclease Z [Ligilactobacillus apodemi]KRL83684.1 ribonuclease Z [Ligilactobacillus apodemi DSM 16634 = JCM 16172]MBD5069851.1 ribonuclease Z [Lactobacillus sp.]MCR1900541.1 ribonuclease Z [Ligilactobacillus apodemi]